MKTIKLDENRNPVFKDGKAVYLTGGEAFKQLLETYLQIFRGEWFLNPDYGNNILNYIADRLPLPVIATRFSQEILRLEYVQNVSFIYLQMKGDTLLINLSVVINGESFQLDLEV